MYEPLDRGIGYSTNIDFMLLYTTVILMKLTVVIPAFNMEKYIERCVRSVLNSTMRDSIQIIVILGKSTDNTDMIVSDLSQYEQNILVLKSTENDPALMRNIGIEHCQTEYITFLDCDDYVNENTYETLLSHGDFDVVNSSYQLVSEDEQILSQKQFKNMATHTSYESLLSIGLGYINGEVWNKVYRSTFLKKHHIRFNSEHGIYGEDLLFNWICFAKGASLYSTDSIIYNHTLQTQSITQKREKRNLTSRFVFILEKFYNCIDTADVKQLYVFSQIMLSLMINNLVVFKTAVIDKASITEVLESYRSIPQFQKLLQLVFHGKETSLKRKVLCLFIRFRLYPLISLFF